MLGWDWQPNRGNRLLMLRSVTFVVGSAMVIMVITVMMMVGAQVHMRPKGVVIGFCYDRPRVRMRQRLPQHEHRNQQ